MPDPGPTNAATPDPTPPDGDGREMVRERLQLFLERITEGAESTEPRIGRLHDHEMARFALADLLPNRIVAAGVFPAVVTISDAEHLSLYLDDIEVATLGQLAVATDADTLADVVLRAAEDLHSYLLGHDIIAAGYRHLTAGSLFRRTENRPTTSSLASWQAHPASSDEAGASRSPVAEDSHEYALAA